MESSTLVSYQEKSNASGDQKPRKQFIAILYDMLEVNLTDFLSFNHITRIKAMLTLSPGVPMDYHLV